MDQALDTISPSSDSYFGRTDTNLIVPAKEFWPYSVPCEPRITSTLWKSSNAGLLALKIVELVAPSISTSTDRPLVDEPLIPRTAYVGLRAVVPGTVVLGIQFPNSERSQNCGSLSWSAVNTLTLIASSLTGCSRLAAVTVICSITLVRAEVRGSTSISSGSFDLAAERTTISPSLERISRPVPRTRRDRASIGSSVPCTPGLVRPSTSRGAKINCSSDWRENSLSALASSCSAMSKATDSARAMLTNSSKAHSKTSFCRPPSLFPTPDVAVKTGPHSQ